ncbi:hypothetical protein CDAR_313291 [Caerostris darwini]|uniref:Uncharacterized protein n=1 Tax=Caerostris darwini TaxID=1538125 RepID=A0AAV4QK86_9ARAC|nr:hypothetical protein CDAR_313291 [Caerostris darwini]
MKHWTIKSVVVRSFLLKEFLMKLRLMVVLMMFVAVLATSIAGDDHDYADADDGEDEIPYKKKDPAPRWKRPWDLQIRVPFFQMFLKREKSGPARLALQVFPDHNRSLVEFNHQWWK